MDPNLVRLYTITRKKSFRPKEGDRFKGLNRISVGQLDIVFDPGVDVYHNVTEDIAIRVQKEYEIKLEATNEPEIKKDSSK